MSLREMGKNIEAKSKNYLPIIDSKFRTIQILHEGKYSTIYKAIPLSNPNKRVVLKIFYFKKSKSVIYRKSFSDLIKGEFYLYKKLESKFFPKVYEIGYDTKLSSIYYTMEFLENCKSILSYYNDLLEHNKSEIMDEKKFANIVYKTTLALTYLHSFNLVHYNISPKNILIYFPDEKKSSIPEVKIISLSLAERNKNYNKNKYRKNYYLSPEVMQKDNLVDYRTDYFSFGVTILHSLLVDLTKNSIDNFLFNKPASSASNLIAIDGYLELIDNYKIRHFLKGLLQENPNERFQSANNIVITLNKYFKENFQISKFNIDFLFKQQKEKFIIRNHVIQHILDIFQNFRLTISSKDNNPQFIIIKGKMGYGVSRTIKEIEDTFSYLMYNFIVIKSKNNRNRFEEIIELLNILLIRNNHNCKDTNRNHLIIIKRINTLIKKKADLTQIFDQVYSQVKKFVAKSKLLIIFSDIHKYDHCSLKFINYLKSINSSNSNIFIIASLSYKTAEEIDNFQKIIPHKNDLGTIELKTLNIENIKLLRKHLFGKINDLPENFDSLILRATKGNFKKVILLYNKLMKNEVIYNSFRSYFYNTENKYLKS